MRIAILNITSGGLSGGYKKYLRNILPRLAYHPKISDVLVGMPETVNFDKWEGDFSSVKWLQLSSSIWPWIEVDNKAKKRIEKFAPNVVFIPTARSWRIDGLPIVNIIRNIEPFTVPFSGNPCKEVIKNLGRTYMAKTACKRSTRVIAVSRYVKNFLYKKWNIESSKIGTVYHGAEIPNTLEALSIPDCLQNQKSDQYVFTAGSIRPARGLEDIIHALGILRGMGQLVIAGGIDPGMEKYRLSLENTAMKLGIEKQIIWAGRLSEYEMSWCYYNSSVFVMTSRAEACPNIVLEAMAHGCVCISTETLPMPEFFNDAAVYYPPKDSKALAKRIKTVLAWDDNQRNAMSEKAKMRAAEFSWDVCADKTVAELAKAAESGQSGKL